MEFIDPWFLYFWTRLDSIHNILFNIVFFGAFSALITCIIIFSNGLGEWSWIDKFDFEKSPENDDRDYDYSFNKAKKIKAALIKYKRICITAIVVVMMSSFLMAAIPNKKDMAIIYIIPKIANNEKIQNESIDIYNMAKAALREYSGLKPKEKE